MTTKEITRVSIGELSEVTPEALTRLAEWIATASAEAVVWAFPEMRAELREWMKTHKAAKETRVAATRLECLALRRIATSGGSNRLTSHQERVSASWLAEMSDSEFEEFLDSTESTASPYALYKQAKAAERAVDSWFVRREPRDLDEVEVIHLATAAETILETIGRDGEPFTVAEAADELFSRVSRMWDGRDVGDEENLAEIAGEPLREVIRKVLRTPSGGDDLELHGRTVRIPAWVTFESKDTINYQRISWDAAQLWHLRQMTEARQKQAGEMQAKANELQYLLDALTHASEASGTTRVVDLVSESLAVAIPHAA